MRVGMHCLLPLECGVDTMRFADQMFVSSSSERYASQNSSFAHLVVSKYRLREMQYISWTGSDICRSRYNKQPRLWTVSHSCISSSFHHLFVNGEILSSGT